MRVSHKVDDVGTLGRQTADHVRICVAAAALNGGVCRVLDRRAKARASFMVRDNVDGLGTPRQTERGGQEQQCQGMPRKHYFVNVGLR